MTRPTKVNQINQSIIIGLFRLQRRKHVKPLQWLMISENWFKLTQSIMKWLIMTYVHMAMTRIHETPRIDTARFLSPSVALSRADHECTNPSINQSIVLWFNTSQCIKRMKSTGPLTNSTTHWITNESRLGQSTNHSPSNTMTMWWLWYMNLRLVYR